MHNNKKTYWITGIVLAAIVILFWLGKQSTPKTVQSDAVNPDALPGMQVTNAPWQPEINHLKERLSTIGLPALTEEGSALHIHQHIDIYIDGKSIAIPADIGVQEAAQFISPVHTHDASGVIHVESPTMQTFTLGQFFDIWGVRFSTTCIGGYCNTNDKLMKVFVNGNEIKTNPRDVALDSHQEIVVTYGTAQELPNPVPATYLFAAGL